MAEHFDAFVDTIVVDLGKTPSQATSEVTATRERLALILPAMELLQGAL
jgi:hypothetical protein